MIETWKTEVGASNRDEFEKSQKNLRCIKFDGKKSEVSVGHNKTERCHNLTFIREPEPRYIDHIECEETGLEMADASMKVISKRNF